MGQLTDTRFELTDEGKGGFGSFPFRSFSEEKEGVRRTEGMVYPFRLLKWTPKELRSFLFRVLLSGYYERHLPEV